MNNHRFEIDTPIHRKIASIGAYLILLAMMIVSISFSKLPVSVIAVMCALILVLTAGLYMTFMLHFQVTDNVISIRTQFGKMHTVTCGDIVEISCSQCESTRQGVQLSITVKTEQFEFTVDGRKEGFETFAGYLLDKLESGEIREFAVSDSCKQTLKHYCQGVFAFRKH